MQKPTYEQLEAMVARLLDMNIALGKQNGMLLELVERKQKKTGPALQRQTR